MWRAEEFIALLHSQGGHAMTKPILMAVDDHSQDLGMLQQELLKRYGADYDVLTDHSAASALQRLEELRAADAQVAILLAAFEMSAMTGIAYLERRTSCIHARNACCSSRTASVGVIAPRRSRS